MDPTAYQQQCKRTECDQDAARLRYYGLLNAQHPTLLPVRLNHGVLGLTGEVGELAGAVERWLHYGRPLDLINIKEEIGDCLWYVALLCNAAGFDLGEIMEANIAKLRTRYPEKWEGALAAESGRDRAAEKRAVEARYDNPLANPAGLSPGEFPRRTGSPGIYSDPDCATPNDEKP